MMALSPTNNILHCIHCMNPMELLSLGNGSLSNKDEGYHIKISLYHLLPIKIKRKYKEKFPLLLYSLIRNITEWDTDLYGKLIDEIPKDLLNLILKYFHTLCVYAVESSVK